jgi:hypothetical protein
MPYVKFSVDKEEFSQITEAAKVAGISTSAWVRSQLHLPPGVSRFSEILDETMLRAEALTPNTDFSIPDLYSAIEWREIATEIGVGVLGKRFYEQVVGKNVNGVVPANAKKNRRELYQKR